MWYYSLIVLHEKTSDEPCVVFVSSHRVLVSECQIWQYVSRWVVVQLLESFLWEYYHPGGRGTLEYKAPRDGDNFSSSSSSGKSQDREHHSTFGSHPSRPHNLFSNHINTKTDSGLPGKHLSVPGQPTVRKNSLLKNLPLWIFPFLLFYS